MQKWEYLRIQFNREKPAMSSKWTDFKLKISGKELSRKDFDQYMQTLGDEGWELVSAYPLTYWWDTNGFSDELNFIFKRPK